MEAHIGIGLHGDIHHHYEVGYMVTPQNRGLKSLACIF